VAGTGEVNVLTKARGARPDRNVTFTPKPDLSQAELAMLEQLRSMPDETIDTRDVPESPLSNWASAKRSNLFKPLKRAVTIRLDADVVEWFQAQSGGKGYQTAINRALRQVMERK
jgi:uncharacterized protein (DUF4415 family)